MGGNSLVALQVQTPDVMGAYNNGVDTAQRQQSNSLRIQGQQQDLAQGVDKAKMDSAERVMQMIGAGSMYAMGGNLNGQPDPAKFEEVLDGLSKMGFPPEEINKFRGHPEMAPIAARASMSALQQLQMAKSDRDYELALKKFEADVNAGADAGLVPVVGRGPDGQPVYLQARKDGKMVRSEMPDGVVADPGLKAEATAAGAARGKAAGELQATLPTDLQSASDTVKQVDELLASPGLDSIVGLIDQNRGPMTLGAEGRDALSRLKQLQGKAFLQAYGMLRGGGAITEVEGSKAGEAMARMDRSQDETTFRNALKDFRDAVETGAKKLQEKALRSDSLPQGAPGASQAAPAAADQPSASKTINGKTYVQDANGDWYEQ